ncbi:MULTISPECIES: hypothetical protein [Pseudomonas]|uniref:Uncharacterized protein n=1 Tax=Pseudomonas psychrophila TaxID=122355 RepID=A0ABY0W4M9_9PSED|nr:MULTISPECIES: hypothetical protein [Pseudomonas]KAB0490863.1 hypothetical protein F7Q95_10070 [Pseudomonas psychrophila]KMM99997.1 hypothetical protein TU76_12490 [Pseudomonas psychrophila]MCH4883121.1 hypothetical protein [Pseudomonas sp. TMW22080]QIE34523.1 hypothetical protein G5J76_20635 [Pseudomonas psychrophila]WVI96628.1 hypothetical protein VR624_17805 [Pseudomonas psychrophila]
MNRSERRRYEKEFPKALKKAGDNCGICRKPLKHNSRTFGGVLSDGCAALAGECCQNQLDVVMGSGVYINQNTDAIMGVLEQMKGDSGGQPVADALEASRRLQSGIGGLEDIVERTMRRGGLSRPAQGISLTDTPWKTDDAQWFETHSARSHRLRPMHPGEHETIPTQMKEAVIPDDHRWDILVRQIQKGHRARLAFCRNALMEIPDVEEVIHAIFDTVANARPGDTITADKIAALAKRYHTSKGSVPN